MRLWTNIGLIDKNILTCIVKIKFMLVYSKEFGQFA